MMAKSPVFLSHQDPWLLGYFCKVRPAVQYASHYVASPAVVCKPLCCKPCSSMQAIMLQGYVLLHTGLYCTHSEAKKTLKKHSGKLFSAARNILHRNRNNLLIDQGTYTVIYNNGDTKIFIYLYAWSTGKLNQLGAVFTQFP